MPIAHDPYPLLLCWLREDRAEGVDLSPEDFAQRAALACRETRAGRSVLWSIVDLYPQWASAYRREPAGALERFSLDLDAA